MVIFKLRLGALIPWSVGRLVGRSVGPPKITKKLQNFTKRYKTLQIIEISSPPIHPSFSYMPELP